MLYTYLCVNDDGEIREITRNEKMIEIGSALEIEYDLYCVMKLIDVKIESEKIKSDCPICKKGKLGRFKAILFRCNFCSSVLNRSGQKLNTSDFEIVKRPTGFKRKIYGPQLPEHLKHLDPYNPYQVSDDEYVKYDRLKKIKHKPKRYKVGSYWI